MFRERTVRPTGTEDLPMPVLFQDKSIFGILAHGTVGILHRIPAAVRNVTAPFFGKVFSVFDLPVKFDDPFVFVPGLPFQVN